VTWEVFWESAGNAPVTWEVSWESEGNAPVTGEGAGECPGHAPVSWEVFWESKGNEAVTWVGAGGCLGYAADGYARINGAACVMVTFTVGSLSAINAIAGAYSESLPVIIVTGAPNSNDYSSGHILHHTIGEEDFGQELRCVNPPRVSLREGFSSGGRRVSFGEEDFDLELRWGEAG
jgi:Thiamine pyrophosphate enzyme, N-terminal TPP binding domain